MNPKDGITTMEISHPSLANLLLRSILWVIGWVGFGLVFLKGSSSVLHFLRGQGSMSAGTYDFLAHYGAEIILVAVSLMGWGIFLSGWKERETWTKEKLLLLLVMGGVGPLCLIAYGWSKISAPWDGVFNTAAFLYFGVPAASLNRRVISLTPDKSILRGTHVIKQEVAERHFETLLEDDLERAKEHGFSDKPGIAFWGHSRMPYSKENQHLLICGSPGSGKTQIIYPIIDQIIRRGDRAVIWDVKGTYTQAFLGRKNVSLLAPWDQRSLNWRIGADIQTPEDCHQAAAIVVPDSQREMQPYFTNAARDIVEAIFMHLDAVGVPWGWGDVQNLLQCGLDNLLNTLSRTAFGKSIGTTYFKAKSGSDVYATLRSRTSMIYWLAKAWPAEGVSLREWVNGKGSQVLILGGMPQRERLASETANLALHVMVKELLSLPDDLSRRVWFFLDEIGSLGKVSVISDLGAMGRSKGGCLVAGFQDLGKIEYLYGRDLAKSLANVFSTMIFLRSTDAATSKWASEVLGEQEVIEKQKSSSQGSHRSHGFRTLNSGSSDSESTQEVIRTKKAFLSSQIAQFNDFEGLFRQSGWPVAHLTWPRREIPKTSLLVEESSWVHEKEPLLEHFNADDSIEEHEGDYFGEIQR